MKKTLFFFFLLLISALPVKAVTNSVSVREQLRTTTQQNIQVRQEIKSEAVEAACDGVTSRIQNRINLYENNKEKYQSRHQGVSKRIAALADQLEAEGCDVTQIRTDLKTFDGMIHEFATIFTSFINALKGTQEYACGQSQGQFLNQLQTSRTQLYTVRTQAEGLKTYFQNTLKPHLQAFKTTCSQQLETSGGEL